MILGWDVELFPFQWASSDGVSPASIAGLICLSDWRGIAHLILDAAYVRDPRI